MRVDKHIDLTQADLTMRDLMHNTYSEGRKSPRRGSNVGTEAEAYKANSDNCSVKFRSSSGGDDTYESDTNSKFQRVSITNSADDLVKVTQHQSNKDASSSLKSKSSLQ